MPRNDVNSPGREGERSFCAFIRFARRRGGGSNRVAVEEETVRVSLGEISEIAGGDNSEDPV